MNQANRDYLEETVRKYKKYYFTQVREMAIEATEHILRMAFSYRLNAQGAHNYTGNLINSIGAVVILPPNIARITRLPEKTEIFLEDERIGLGETPYYIPMSKQRRKVYVYNSKNIDFDSVASDDNPLEYKPEVTTDDIKGPQKVRKWASEARYQKNGKNDYVQIQLAYTMDYAMWVEKAHHTTGYYKTREFAQRIIEYTFML